MKKLIQLCAVLLASPLLSALSLAQTADAAIEPDPVVPLMSPRRVAVGMTRDTLKSAAGMPDAILDANVWVYWNFRVREVPADENHDALLVVFEKERVKFFKFTASAPVRAFIARQKAAAPRTVAAK